MPMLPEGTLLNGAEVAINDWPLLEAQESLPASGKVLVPVARWLEEFTGLGGDEIQRIGVILDVDSEVDTFADRLTRVPLIAISFPAFNDGRGLSLATLLRTRYGFKGELRAVGVVHEDVVHYLLRCGFDSLLLPPGRNIDVAKRGLSVMSHYYQGSVIEPKPAFRRVQRGA